MHSMVESRNRIAAACGPPVERLVYIVVFSISSSQIDQVPSLCDVWSCGVVLFACIAGYLPFEDQNTSELYQKILKGESARITIHSSLEKNELALSGVI